LTHACLCIFLAEAGGIELKPIPTVLLSVTIQEVLSFNSGQIIYESNSEKHILSEQIWKESFALQNMWSVSASMVERVLMKINSSNITFKKILVTQLHPLSANNYQMRNGILITKLANLAWR
jgi:hypothetical protein